MLWLWLLGYWWLVWPRHCPSRFGRPTRLRLAPPCPWGMTGLPARPHDAAPYNVFLVRGRGFITRRRPSRRGPPTGEAWGLGRDLARPTTTCALGYPVQPSVSRPQRRRAYVLRWLAFRRHLRRQRRPPSLHGVVLTHSARRRIAGVCTPRGKRTRAEVDIALFRGGTEQNPGPACTGLRVGTLIPCRAPAIRGGRRCRHHPAAAATAATTPTILASAPAPSAPSSAAAVAPIRQALWA